jgi:hypothetical protein
MLFSIEFLHEIFLSSLSEVFQELWKIDEIFLHTFKSTLQAIKFPSKRMSKSNANLKHEILTQK